MTLDKGHPERCYEQQLLLCVQHPIKLRRSFSSPTQKRSRRYAANCIAACGNMEDFDRKKARRRNGTGSAKNKKRKVGIQTSLSGHSQNSGETACLTRGFVRCAPREHDNSGKTPPTSCCPSFRTVARRQTCVCSQHCDHRLTCSYEPSGSPLSVWCSCTSVILSRAAGCGGVGRTACKCARS